MAFYLDVQKNQPERWNSWGLSDEQQRRLVRHPADETPPHRFRRCHHHRTHQAVEVLQQLLYCPNDLRMPKATWQTNLHANAPRRTFFDPYLRVAARLKALTEMGHITKVELIVLGGTWSDYPESCQIWFIRELFRALNDGSRALENLPARKHAYESAGISCDPEPLKAFVAEEQRRIDNRETTYNQAFDRLYGENAAWASVAQWQRQRGKSSKPSTMSMSTGSTA